VTGSGPHSGDKDATNRLPFDVRDVTQLHADLVFLLFGLTFGLVVALRATDAGLRVVRRAQVVLVVALAQGAIGFVQYFTNLPVALVAAHLLGACLVWITTLRLALAVRRDTYDGSPAGRQIPSEHAVTAGA
jgi:cytochrome c oxidase assembly protein subunit 15